LLDLSPVSGLASGLGSLSGDGGVNVGPMSGEVVPPCGLAISS
jgi:hypothetical protein